MVISTTRLIESKVRTGQLGHEQEEQEQLPEEEHPQSPAMMKESSGDELRR
jgi:hypothetical protein